MAVILGSSLVAAVVAKILDYFVIERMRIEEVRYQKLYGPLRYKLLEMEVISMNRKDLMQEIAKELSAEQRIESIQKEIRPLVQKWISCKEEVGHLLESNAGYIKREHICLVKNFLDGCLKREITNDGKSHRTTKERVDKLLVAISVLQRRLLHE